MIVAFLVSIELLGLSIIVTLPDVTVMQQVMACSISCIIFYIALNRLEKEK